MTQTLKLTRDLVDRLPDRTDARGPIVRPDPEPEYYQRISNAILRTLEPGEDLWVFAIGSLIWKPRCIVTGRRAALVKGWHRSFCLGPDTRYRGSPNAPGYMLSLEPGGECRGVVLRLEAETRETALPELLKTEPPYPPEWVEAETDQGTVRAIAFTVPKWEGFVLKEPPEPQLVEILASAVGHVGTMADYLLNTVTHLEEVGVHDPHLWRLQEQVAEKLAQLPPREPG